jgi:hypothetical protein
MNCESGKRNRRSRGAGPATTWGRTCSRPGGETGTSIRRPAIPHPSFRQRPGATESWTGKGPGITAPHMIPRISRSTAHKWRRTTTRFTTPIRACRKALSMTRSNEQSIMIVDMVRNNYAPLASVTHIPTRIPVINSERRLHVLHLSPSLAEKIERRASWGARDHDKGRLREVAVSPPRVDTTSGGVGPRGTFRGGVFRILRGGVSGQRIQA